MLNFEALKFGVKGVPHSGSVSGTIPMSSAKLKLSSAKLLSQINV